MIVIKHLDRSSVNVLSHLMVEGKDISVVANRTA